MNGLNRFSLILIVLLAISLACSGADYLRVGGSDQAYEVDHNVFGDPATQTTTTGIIELSSDSTYPPLIADLDKDGVKEIIVLEGSGLTLYHSKNLVSVTGVTHGLTAPTSNLEIFDIDGDGIKEIILAGANKEIKIFSFNGSHVITENTLNFIWGTYSGGSMLIRCRDTNECLLIAQDDDTRYSTELRAFVFSSSNGTHATVNLETTASTNVFNCFSKIPQIMLGNLDNQGDDEYIITSVLTDIMGSEELKVYAVWVNNSDKTDISLLWDVNLRTNGISNEHSCEAGLYENWVSAPLVYDISNDNGDLSEIAIAYRKTHTEIELAYMRETGEIIKTFPNFPENWDGVSVSNVIPLDYHPDTSVTDMCVLTNAPGADYGLYCTARDSLLFGWLSGTNELYLRTLWNISNEYKSYKGLIQTTESNDGDDIRELTTTWGIIDIPNMNDDTFCVHDTCTMSYVWLSRKVNGSFIISSVGDTNGDVLVRQKKTLWYIDDNFINTPGQITGVTFNPCITEDIVKANATVQVTVKVDDVDGDAVNARVQFYYGEGFPETSSEDVIYDAMNESESDGHPEFYTGSSLGVWGARGYDLYTLLKDNPSNSFNEIWYNVTQLVGNVEALDLVYDWYICPTSASSFGNNPQAQCSETPTLLKDNFELAKEWGFSPGLRKIKLDISYFLSSSKNYIIWAEFVSSDYWINSYYQLASDADSPIAHMKLMVTRDLVTNATSNDSISSILDFQLVFSEILGESFDSGWTETNRPHGSSFTFSTVASIILNNAILRVCGRDTTNPSEEDCRDYTYSVGTEGVVYGDTICEETYELATAPVIDEEGEPVPELSGIPALIIPEDTIPSTYYPLLSLLIIGLIAVGAVFTSSQYGIKEGSILGVIGGGAAILTWLGLIMVGMVAAWTLLVGVIFAAAGIGISVFISSSR